MSLLSLALLPVLFTLKTSYDIEQFFPLQDDTYQKAVALQKKYGLEQSPALVILLRLPNSEMWTTKERAEDVKRLTQTLKQVPSVKNVLNYANRAGAQISETSIQVGNLVDVTAPEEWPERFRADSLMTPIFLSEDQSTALVFVELDPLLDISKIGSTLENFRALIATEMPQVLAQFGGVPTLQSDFQKLLESEVGRFIGLSFLATFFVIVILFRTWQTWLQSLLLVMTGNLFALAIIALLGWPLTVLSVTTPILVSVIVVSQAIHTYFRLWEREKELGTSWPVLAGTHKELLGPNFLSGVIASVGFATLGASEIPMISSYGWTVALALVASWVSTTLVMVPFSILGRQAEPREWTHFRARWILKMLQYRRPILATVTGVFVLSLAGAGLLNWQARLYDDLPTVQQSRQITELIDQKMGGTVPLDLEISLADGQSWSDPELLAKFDSLIKSVRDIPGVGTAVGYTDFLRAFEAKSELPTSRQAASEMIFLYSMNDTNPLRQFISTDEKSSRMMIRLQDLPAKQMLATVDLVKLEAKALFPESGVEALGMARHIHLINNRVSQELIYGFWPALLGVTVMLMFILKSVRWALVSLLPNLIPPAFLIAGLALTQTPIKPPLALIFSISIGLAFNNTIYLMLRLRSSLRNGKKYRLVEDTFRTEGTTCLLSTLVIASGFIVFLFANFSVNQVFGAFMLLSVAAGVVGDLVFLPCLIKWKPEILGLRPLASAIKRGPTAENNKNPEGEKPMKIAASVALLVISGLLVPRTSAAATDPALKARFEKALKQFNSKDEEATIKMSIIEADGTRKAREISLKRATGQQEQRVLARILAPSDLKGTGFLSIINKETENQWVYLPSSKQTRKVVGGEQKEGGVLGSELRYEDFNPSVIRETEIQMLKTEKIGTASYDVLEYKMAPGQGPYDRAQIWIENGKEIPYQIEYFEGGTKVKTIQFSDYRKIGGILRPAKMNIKNLKNNRGTEIELTSVKVNKGIKSQSLSLDALAKTW